MIDYLQALNSRRPHRDERGFSLFELMFVVLIIGVLVSVAVLILGASTAISRVKACKANPRIIDGAIRQYEAEGMGVPSSIASLVAAGFIKKAPNDPHPGYTQYTIESGRAKSGDDHQTYP